MKLFISYVTDDTSRVEELAQILRDAGHDIWFDYQPLPGQDQQQEQLNAIRACELFIHVVTRQSHESDALRDEFEQALKHNRRIMSVSLDNNADIPTWLNDYPHADFSLPPTVPSVTQLLGHIQSASMQDVVSQSPTVKRKQQRVSRSKTLPIVMIALVLLLVAGVFVYNTLSKQAEKQAVIDLSEQALEAFEDKDHEEAIQLYTDLLEFDATHLEAYINRGRAYFSLERYETAITNYEQVLELSPDYAPAYFYRGNAYSRLDELEKAIEDFSNAIELDPNYAWAYFTRGFLYSELGEDEKAIGDYNKAIDLDINEPTIYYNRGVKYWQQEEYEKAIEDFSNAIELDSTYVSSYHGLGNVYYKLEQFDLALENYEMYLDLAGDSANETIIKRVEDLSD